MLANRDEPDVRARIDQEVARTPFIAAVIGAAAGHPEAFAVDLSASGFEIAPLNQVKGARNRCRLKLFRPREEKERVCAFFYKRSNLSFSRDRYSYGAVEFLPGQIPADEIRGWLAWLQSGFDPEQRPSRLKRGLSYTIPE
jgi:hypothetical protein